MYRKVPPPDGGWGWIVAGCSFMNHFLLEGYTRSSGVIYLQVIERFQTSSLATTWIQASFNAIQQIGIGSLLGVLVQRYTCRRLTVLGGVLFSLAYLVSAFTPNVYFMYFSYSFIGGIGSGLISSPAVVVINEYFDKSRGKAMGVAALGVALGTFAIPPLMTALFDHYGYRGSLLVLAAISSHHCLFAGFYRPLPATGVRDESSASSAADPWSNRADPDLEKVVPEGYMKGRSRRKSETDVEDRRLEERRMEERTKEGGRSLRETGSRSTDESDACVTWRGTGENGSAVKYNSGSCVHLNTGSKVSRLVNGWKGKWADSKAGEKKNGDWSLLDRNGAGRHGNTSVGDYVADESASFGRWRWKARLAVFRSPPFVLYCFVLFTIPSANTATFLFLPGLAKERGVPDQRAAMLVSIIGASSAVGTLAIGCMFDVTSVRRHRALFHGLLCLLLGASVVAMTTSVRFVAMATVSAAYGFLVAGVLGQRATALTDYVTSGQLTSAFGFMTLFQGLGNLIGVTLQGYLKDVFQTYNVCFYYGGFLTCFASTLLILYHVIKIVT